MPIQTHTGGLCGRIVPRSCLLRLGRTHSDCNCQDIFSVTLGWRGLDFSGPARNGATGVVAVAREDCLVRENVACRTLVEKRDSYLCSERHIRAHWLVGLSVSRLCDPESCRSAQESQFQAYLEELDCMGDPCAARALEGRPNGSQGMQIAGIQQMAGQVEDKRLTKTR